ncbi:Sec1-like protein [Lipomyces oligophaga]|uniref:Sec1-like protein n=1 Tax=Lipomyces oligophaga TaxID=45792 RepID=UPI0034CF1AE3
MSALLTSINPRALKSNALDNFLTLLETVRGKKSIVLDRTLSAALSYIVRFSVLQEHGVENIFWLDDGPQKETSMKSIIYVIRGDIRNTQIASGQIKQLLQDAETEYEFNIFVYPEKMLSVEKVFEEEGVLGDVIISEWNLGFIPLEDDLLSIELPDAGFKDLYLNGLPTTVSSSALALHALQQQYGLYPRIIGKGDNAKKLCELLLRMRREALSAPDQEWAKGEASAFEQLIIVERGTDMVTPLMTQLTYEGLIDELYGITSSQADVPNALFSPATSKTISNGSTQIGDHKTRKVVLDSNDALYASLRDLNFAVVGPTLNKFARKLNEDYGERHQAKTVSQIKEFVSKLSGLQAEHQSLRLHTNMAEDIMNRTQTEFFNRSLEVQQNLVASGLDTSTLNQTIEELMARGVSLDHILRLLAIESLTSGGIKDKEYAQFKRLVYTQYGFEHLLTFSALAKLDLIYSRSSKTSKNAQNFQFSNLRKALRLIVDDVNEQKPDDIAYVYSGYAPLSIRLVQYIIQKRALGPKIASVGGSGWRGSEDFLRYIIGSQFDETQSSDDKSVRSKVLAAARKDVKSTVAIFFLGGITFTEISALRFIARKEADRRNLIIMTTGIIDGKQIIQAATDGTPSISYGSEVSSPPGSRAASIVTASDTATIASTNTTSIL